MNFGIYPKVALSKNTCFASNQDGTYCWYNNTKQENGLVHVGEVMPVPSPRKVFRIDGQNLILVATGNFDTVKATDFALGLVEGGILYVSLLLELRENTSVGPVGIKVAENVLRFNLVSMGTKTIAIVCTAEKVVIYRVDAGTDALGGPVVAVFSAFVSAVAAFDNSAVPVFEPKRTVLIETANQCIVAPYNA